MLGGAQAPSLIQPVGDADFGTKVLQSKIPVLVEYRADWAPDCNKLAPVLEQVAQEYAGRAVVYKLNIDTDTANVESYGVFSVPTCLVFKDGHKFEQLVGVVSKAAIEAALDRSLGQP